MLIIFDLDGTLIDSAEDLAASVNAMLTHFDRRPLSPELIQSYVGNGAGTLVKRALGEGVSIDLYDRGLTYFLNYYEQHSLDNTALYPGVQGMLDDLQAMGHSMSVLSNKPAHIATDILKGLKVAKYFTRVCGGDTFSSKKPDPAGLLTILSEAGVQPREALMIGDTPIDVQTAHNAGVRACGVGWGFQPQSLPSSGAEFLINKPHQLFAYL